MKWVQKTIEFAVGGFLTRSNDPEKIDLGKILGEIGLLAEFRA
jgi:hypothetical protein